MDNYEKYKKAYYKKHHLVKRKYKFVNKLLVLGILFVGVLIAVKVNPTAASWVKTHVYMDNFSFAQIENWYNKYIYADMHDCQKLVKYIDDGQYGSVITEVLE